MADEIFKLSNDDRSRIKTKSIIGRLQRTAMGKESMTALQIRCAEILLKKAMPDLTSVTVIDEGPKGNQTVMNINLGGIGGSNMQAKTVQDAGTTTHTLNMDLSEPTDDVDDLI